jgi:hypothetical protein
VDDKYEVARLLHNLNRHFRLVLALLRSTEHEGELEINNADYLKTISIKQWLLIISAITKIRFSNNL